jgi:hypothetical protein
MGGLISAVRRQQRTSSLAQEKAICFVTLELGINKVEHHRLIDQTRTNALSNSEFVLGRAVGATRQNTQQSQNLARDLDGHATKGGPVGSVCQPYLAIETVDAPAGGAGGEGRAGLAPGFAFGDPVCDLPLMPFHKFKIGQRVSYRPTRDTFPTWYTVTALLPAKDGKFKYRIRRQGASEDLVVRESELRENRER